AGRRATGRLLERDAPTTQRTHRAPCGSRRPLLRRSHDRRTRPRARSRSGARSDPAPRLRDLSATCQPAAFALGWRFPDPHLAAMTPTDPPAPSASPIAFIGGGNMARSLVGGLIVAGADRARIRVAEPDARTRAGLAEDFGVACFASAEEAVPGAATWVFAVKPQVMRQVCETLASAAQSEQPLVVSIAAGITASQLDRWLGGGL